MYASLISQTANYTDYPKTRLSENKDYPDTFKLKNQWL